MVHLLLLRLPSALLSNASGSLSTYESGDVNLLPQHHSGLAAVAIKEITIDWQRADIRARKRVKLPISSVSRSSKLPHRLGGRRSNRSILGGVVAVAKRPAGGK